MALGMLAARRRPSPPLGPSTTRYGTAVRTAPPTTVMHVEARLPTTTFGRGLGPTVLVVSITLTVGNVAVPLAPPRLPP